MSEAKQPPATARKPGQMATYLTRCMPCAVGEEFPRASLASHPGAHRWALTGGVVPRRGRGLRECRARRDPDVAADISTSLQAPAPSRTPLRPTLAELGRTDCLRPPHGTDRRR